MDDTESRLNQISTQWTVVFRAHEEETGVRQTAQAELLLRYHRAIYRYVLAVVRDVDVAEELCQQFSLKFIEGAFHNAHPDRGRFRNYVKSSLINLIRQHYKSKLNQPRVLPDQLSDRVVEMEIDKQDRFNQQWREEILNQTWHTLKEIRPVFHDLLRLRVSDPELTSRQLADRYVKQNSMPMTAANVRKSLQRAHSFFADLLIEELATQLDSTDLNLMRDELRELDLLKFCNTALERWNAQK